MKGEKIKGIIKNLPGGKSPGYKTPRKQEKILETHEELEGRRNETGKLCSPILHKEPDQKRIYEIT